MCNNECAVFFYQIVYLCTAMLIFKECEYFAFDTLQYTTSDTQYCVYLQAVIYIYIYYASSFIPGFTYSHFIEDKIIVNNFVGKEVIVIVRINLCFLEI